MLLKEEVMSQWMTVISFFGECVVAINSVDYLLNYKYKVYALEHEITRRRSVFN